MASLLNDPAAAVETVKEWVLTTKTGKAAAAYAGSFVLAKASDSLSFPYRFMSLLIGTPLLAVYVPLRVAFNRLIYPRAPNIPNAPASFEGATRLTQGLFGFLPEGSATLIPSSVFESLAWALHPGAEKLWKKVDGPKDGLPEGVKGAWIQDPALKKGDEDLVVFWSHGGGYCGRVFWLDAWLAKELTSLFQCTRLRSLPTSACACTTRWQPRARKSGSFRSIVGLCESL
jgi:hypothetical protein